MLQRVLFYSILTSLISQPFQNLAEAQISHLDLYEKQVVRIMVDSQQADYSMPFTAGKSQSSVGSGLLISPRLILTNAHVIEHARLIRIGRHREDHLKIAKIKHQADDLDLALLELEAEEEAYSNTVTPRYGDIPQQLSTVQVVGFPSGGEQLSITSGVVSRIELHNYVQSMADNHLLIQVDAPINPGNSGGPAYSGSKIIGLSVQSFRNLQNTGFIIPVPILEKFFNDIEDGKYEGTARDEFLGNLERALENQNVRDFFKFKESKGIVMSEIPKGTLLSEVLKPGDVLLSINEKDIGLDGKVVINGQRLDYDHLFDLMRPEENFSLKIFRDQEILRLTAPLPKRGPTDFPQISYKNDADYFIYGGIVFTNLTGNMLKNFFQSSSPTPLMMQYLAKFKHQDAELSYKENFTTISSVLSTHNNRRARDFINDIIISVNGNQFETLKELQTLLLKESDTHALQFFKRKNILILDHKAMVDDQQLVKKTHKIDTLERFHENL